MADRTIQDLKQKQALPLEVKVLMTKSRIREWINEYGEDGVYISFSGGKDSTVLLDLVRQDYPNVRAMFVDTGLEYPEIKQFVKTFDNVDIVRPKMSFKQVIEKYGYPIISKEISKDVYYSKRSLEKGDYNGVHLRKLLGLHTDKDGKKSMFCCEKYKFFLDAPFNLAPHCCNVMKKAPASAYDKKTGRVRITGEIAQESKQRLAQWIRYGCNGFNMKSPVSKPLSFWTEQDILHYIKKKNLKICSVYGDIVADYDGSEQLPNQIDLADLGFIQDNRKLKTTGCERTGCMFCGFGCHLEKESRFQKMKKTHPTIYDYIMRPRDKGGLGYKEIIDWINENGDLNIRY